MSINNLYISHQDHDWCSHPGLELLTDKNFKPTISGDFCTSLSDIGYNLIDTVVDMSQSIYLVDLSTSMLSSMGYVRLFYKLKTVRHKVIDIHNLLDVDTTVLLPALPTRTHNKTIFFAGCSFTHGTGVDQDKKFTSIVSTALSLPMIDLSRPGSSIPWQADTILRSDIKYDDIVVWGLTSIPRITINNFGDETTYTVKDYFKLDKSQQYWHIDYFDSTTQVAETIKAIEQVKNYCDKLKSKLLIVNLFETTWIPLLYHDKPYFLDLLEDFYSTNKDLQFLDKARDNMHPGPLQHRYYADQILKKLC